FFAGFLDSSWRNLIFNPKISSMKLNLVFLSLSLLSLCLSPVVQAQKILIKNVKIFNGVEQGTPKGNILIDGNRIVSITPQPISSDEVSVTIDGQGKYLIPGLIDAHTHITMEGISFMEGKDMDVVTKNLIATRAA